MTGDGPALRLLLVDDDVVDRAAVVRALAEVAAPAEIVEAGDAAEALAVAGDGFDCILLDHNLPRQTGLETLRTLREKQVTTPVVVLTGSGDERLAVAMMKAGAADYVVKGTLPADALWQRIRKAVQLADAERFEQQVLGVVSHDLRNPIAVMLMNAEVLARLEGLPPQAQRPLQRIRSSGEKAARMISDLLDYTRARGGRGLTVERRPTDLHAVLRDCLDEVRSSHPGREIRHEAVGDGSCLCDVDRVLQIVDNLVANALAYGDPGRPVTVKSGGADPAEAEVLVHNEGAPIPPELLSRIFEPFARAAEHVASSRRSLGLGLYIVRQLAKAHGGDVAVRSTREEGTTFRIVLPRR